jgi:hypothetical protein
VDTSAAVQSIANVYAYDSRGVYAYDAALEAYKRSLAIFLSVFRDEKKSSSPRRDGEGNGSSGGRGGDGGGRGGSGSGGAGGGGGVGGGGGGGGEGGAGAGGGRVSRCIVAHTLNDMGAMYIQQRRFAEASDALRSAMEVHRRAEGGERHPLAVLTMYNISMLYQKLAGRGRGRGGRLMPEEPFLYFCFFQRSSVI